MAHENQADSTSLQVFSFVIAGGSLIGLPSRGGQVFFFRSTSIPPYGHLPLASDPHFSQSQQCKEFNQSSKLHCSCLHCEPSSPSLRIRRYDVSHSAKCFHLVLIRYRTDVSGSTLQVITNHGTTRSCTWRAFENSTNLNTKRSVPIATWIASNHQVIVRRYILHVPSERLSERTTDYPIT